MTEAVPNHGPSRCRALMDRGVVIPDTGSVFIDEDVDLHRIAAGAIIHPGCRVSGKKTSIGPYCELGREAPATILDCLLGEHVKLKGGYFEGAVFLDGSSMGSCAHVRPGTLLEEGANCAHAVGLKQTILLPFMTAGSLINFCDVLMAGGTSRSHHSEIGSSYIHFNFTPHGDKATASLIGDVPRGVMLDQEPIFLGGQGGLVGPARIEYGSTIPAGLIRRKDALKPGLLLSGMRNRARMDVEYVPGMYRNIGRILVNNFTYIGNIIALREWYRTVRSLTMTDDEFRKACWLGALDVLEAVLNERIKRLDQLAANMSESVRRLRVTNASGNEAEVVRQEAFANAWPGIKTKLGDMNMTQVAAQDRDAFLASWRSCVGQDRGHVVVIQGLSDGTKTIGKRWLQAIVDKVVSVC